MAAISVNQIISDFDTHIQKEGSGYASWYVGITNDLQRRLFTDHNVAEKNSWWIHRETYSVDDARRVENFFINQRHTDGNPGGGDTTSRFVYAYKKTSSTTP